MSDLESKLNDLLTNGNFTIATAESCTGGLIASKITDISGSSTYFERGVITYSDRSKIELLGVPEETLKQFGAVSSETAQAMARGIHDTAKVDIGLAVTGIAGPTGGTPEKPVGLVYIAIAYDDEVEHFKFNFRGSRLDIKDQTTHEALNLLLKLINRKSKKSS